MKLSPLIRAFMAIMVVSEIIGDLGSSPMIATMVNKDAKLFVTFEENNKYLLESGKYSTAKIKVKNAFKRDEQTKESLETVLILEQMQTIKKPYYKAATKNTTLGYPFIKMALNLDDNGVSQRPPKPRRNASIQEWNVYKNWNKLSNEEKIRPHLLKMANDSGCQLVSFELV